MSSDSSFHVPFTLWDTTTVSEMGPTIVVGSAKAQGSKAKPGGQQLVHPVPHRGALASSSFVSESRPSGFLHALSCGLVSSRPGF
jgi:hypothetical protein